MTNGRAAAALVVALVAGVPLAAAQPAASELRITLLGTGNPRPSIERFGPAILIEAGPERVLVDAGRGTTMRLWQAGGKELLAGLTAVLLTHLHSDHVVGMPDVWLTGWLFGRREPLTVFGPAGTSAMMAALQTAFAFDVTTRGDIDEKLPEAGARVYAADIDPGVVIERNGLKVTAFAVDHGPVKPAYGYRVDYRGRSAVLSGDTRPNPAVVAQARGVDVLVHEVLSVEVERRATAMADPRAVDRVIAHHTTVEEAARIFEEAAPRLAVYSHIVPSPARAEDLVPATRKIYRGPLEVGYDMMMITIGDRIRVERRKPVPDE